MWDETLTQKFMVYGLVYGVFWCLIIAVIDFTIRIYDENYPNLPCIREAKEYALGCGNPTSLWQSFRSENHASYSGFE